MGKSREVPGGRRERDEVFIMGAGHEMWSRQRVHAFIKPHDVTSRFMLAMKCMHHNSAADQLLS